MLAHVKDNRYPQRVVCLTAETTEIAFALGAGDQVVGVSGYATRPPEARRKPRVSAFTTARLDKIFALRPDLVLSFSDLQADIVRELVKGGLNVLSLNQRSLAETCQAIRLIGAVLGRSAEAERLVGEFQRALEATREAGQRLPRRPRVFFEEWDDPLIAGIHWVSEIIEVAGGQDIFAELREQQSATGRIVDPAEVIRRDPQIIVASWCGKKVVKERIRRRSGWDRVTAVRENEIYEIKSPDILTPGPSLLYGMRQMQQIIADWASRREGRTPAAGT